MAKPIIPMPDEHRPANSNRYLVPLEKIIRIREPVEAIADALIARHEELNQAPARVPRQPRAKTLTVKNVQAKLDELFALKVTLAESPRERDAIILRQLPPALQETVGAIIQEFADLCAEREDAAKALDAQIRAAVRLLGQKVEGTHLQATYGKSRYACDYDRLLKIAEREPEIHDCLTQGEPSVSIRTRAQRQRPTPLLYDIHTT